MQRTGSFKIRGALNAVLSLPDEKAALGVATHSSGNHGQAVALAARERGIPCTVVVPHTCPQVKVDAIRGYGAAVVLCEPTQQSRTSTMLDQAARMGGANIVHPYDQAEVIAGQGTIGLELLSQVPDLAAVVVPTSGGGMITGIATALQGLKPTVAVHAVEPQGKRLGEAFKRDTRVVDQATVEVAIDTVADAIRTQAMGQLPWELARDRVHPTVLTVNDTQITQAMRFAFERMKLVLEPAAATGVAAMLAGHGADLVPSGGTVVVVLCGGNVELADFARLAMSSS